jgi:NADH-quinone oxidoreductase subunit M
MGFVTLGLFAMNQQAVEGAMFQMLSHGVVSGALFLCVGVIYDRLHTRDISRYGGLVKNMPVYATIFMIMTMASIGLPGTSGFVGEFLVLIGTYKVSTTATFVAATGVVLGAAYMLFLYRRVVFGPLTKPDVKAMRDLSAREVFIFAPLVILVFWMGIHPASFIQPMSPSIKRVIDHYNARVLNIAAPAEAAVPVKTEKAEPKHEKSQKGDKK